MVTQTYWLDNGVYIKYDDQITNDDLEYTNSIYESDNFSQPKFILHDFSEAYSVKLKKIDILSKASSNMFVSFSSEKIAKVTQIFVVTNTKIIVSIRFYARLMKSGSSQWDIHILPTIEMGFVLINALENVAILKSYIKG